MVWPPGHIIPVNGPRQARVEEKSGLGTRYKELVMAKLAFFKDKILMGIVRA